MDHSVQSFLSAADAFLQRLPQRFGLSGAALKWIALLSMLTDHFGATILRSLYRAGPTHSLWLIYRSSRLVGRLAFPIYCFFIAEGFSYVKDDPVRLRRYLCRLGLFFLISEVPFDWALKGSFFTLSGQNVYATLLLGALCLVLIEQCRKGPLYVSVPFRLRAAVCLALILGLSGLAQLCHTDYRWIGVLVIVNFYLFRDNRLFAALAAVLLLRFSSSLEWAALATVPLLLLYNGQRGKQNKWLFYGFYPAHLAVLALIRDAFW